MNTAAEKAVLDRDQLREITLDEPELMREILSALIDDTARQVTLLGDAIRDGDSTRCLRLAHYSKGACINVGANRAASVLQQIEQRASEGNLAHCELALGELAGEIERLRSEGASVIQPIA